MDENKNGQCGNTARNSLNVHHNYIISREEREIILII